ncbi:MAG: YbhB/YbcL family Raf kinase inhibitor-like protein [Armatimonadota bacterium]|jgi:Raf kinase inhibitor-like YbhB/YbcL family protein
MLTRSGVSASLVVLLTASSAFVVGCRRQQPTTEPAEPTAAPAVTPGPEEGPAVDWELTSTAFANGERIPEHYTADGANVSPPLEWTAPPEGTAELALICDDPDAPRGTWNHWIVYGLSPEVTSLPEDVASDATVTDPALRQGVTSFGETGYGGPAPPSGTHRYQFTLYALSEATGLDAGADKQQVLAAMEGNIIAQTTLEGLYSR